MITLAGPGSCPARPQPFFSASPAGQPPGDSLRLSERNRLVQNNAYSGTVHVCIYTRPHVETFGWRRMLFAWTQFTRGSDPNCRRLALKYRSQSANLTAAEQRGRTSLPESVVERTSCATIPGPITVPQGGITYYLIYIHTSHGITPPLSSPLGLAQHHPTTWNHTNLFGHLSCLCHHPTPAPHPRSQ
ncbi:hypothetical protein VTG60DRAFT_2883 [Thermothelomyces hinnuleus]